MGKPIYIFDIDGTLADNSHRKIFLKGPNPNWKNFELACVNDMPVWSVIQTLRQLRKTSEIWIWSGRGECIRNQTLDWLMNNQVIDCRNYRFFYRNENRFRLRADGDYRTNYQIKDSWIADLHESEKRRIVAAFDDQVLVAQVYRKHGIECFLTQPTT